MRARSAYQQQRQAAWGFVAMMVSVTLSVVMVVALFAHYGLPGSGGCA